MYVISKAFYMLVFILVTQNVTAEIYSLNRTIKKAIESSNSTALVLLEADKALIDAQNASHGKNPVLNLSTGASVVSEVMDITLPGRKIRFGDYDSYDINLTVKKLLYDGGRFKALENAGINHSIMNKKKAVAAEFATVYLAKSAFFSILIAEEKASAAQESVQEAINHTKDAHALFEQGMVLKSDVLRAKLRTSVEEMNLITCKAEIEKAKAQFRKILGLNFDSDIQIFWDKNDGNKAITVDFTKALAQRPEFDTFNAALKASEYTIKSIQSAKLPTLMVQGAFIYGRPGLDLPANEWMHYFSGGIRMNYNIWDWGTTRRNIEKAEINRKKIMRSKNDFKRSLSQQVTEALVTLEESRKRVELAAEVVAVSQQNLEIISSAYREGMATETDYDNAYAAYTRALHDHSGAQAARHLSGAYAEYVMGLRFKGEENE